MAQIDWRFMQPLDQSSQIANMALGNQQINAGLAAMGGAVTGYADALKQRNTDQILNALYQAQTSADLPTAMSAVNALQQQYGRGFDQAAVRSAIDTRGSTLAQRDLQNINLQQAQAAQAAIPQVNALAIERMRAAGATPDQIASAQGIQGIDLTQLANQQVGDLRDTRDFNYRQGIDQRNYNRQLLRDAESDRQFQQQFGLQQDAAIQRTAEYLAPQAGQTTQVLDANGNIITTAQPSRLEALQAAGGIVGRINRAESGGDPNAKNPNSTATGTGQFINSTWLSMMNKYRPDLTRGKSEAEILNMRKDPNLSNQMTAHYANDNSAILRKANLPVNDGTIYLAHFAGPDGAKKLLQANPNASAESLLGSKVAAANGKIVRGKTAKQVIDWAARQVGGGTSTAQPSSNLSAAAQAVGITPKQLTDVRAVYNTSLNKSAADYNKAITAANTKGSAAAGGMTPSKWLASQKETSLFGGSSNPMFTDAADVVEMAKSSKAYQSLPPAAQANILDAAYSRVKNAGTFRYETNKSVKTIIDNEAKAYKQNQVESYNNNRKAALDNAVTSLQQQYQAAGSPPPTYQQALKLIDPAQYEKLYGKKKK